MHVHTLLNIHAREERSNKFILLLGLKLVSSVMFLQEFLAQPCPSLLCLPRRQINLVMGVSNRWKPKGWLPSILIYLSHLSPGILSRKIKWNEMVRFKEKHMLCVITVSSQYLLHLIQIKVGTDAASRPLSGSEGTVQLVINKLGI